MKILSQCAILFGIATLGDILSKLFNIPIPGNILGMAILFVLLLFGVIKEHQILDTSDFLMSNMGILFLPGALGIIEEYHHFNGVLIAFILMCIFIVFVIIATTGKSAEYLEKVFVSAKNLEK